MLVLGGWSPGPLDPLRWAVRDQEVDFVEPPLHMPPAGIRWCCTWEAVLLACCIWLALFLLTGGGALPLVQRCVLLLGLVLALPAAVVLLVRGSLRRSLRSARREIERRRVDVVVGFSWGGGVACWLLAERHWRGPTLLLAPTLVAMAAAARLAPLPRPFFAARGEPSDHENDGGDGASPLVRIVHASADGFCPASQRRELEQTGAATQVCEGGHDLGGARAEHAVLQHFAACVADARERKDLDSTLPPPG